MTGVHLLQHARITLHTDKRCDGIAHLLGNPRYIYQSNEKPWNGVQWVQRPMESNGNPCNAGNDIDPGPACRVQEV